MKYQTQIGRISLGVVLVVCLFLTAFRVVPLPAGMDAITMCFPITGPVQRFSREIEPERRELVQVHEGAHAAQCKRLGALAYLTSSRSARGRLELEAEAFCAELRVHAGHNINTEQMSRDMAHALFTGYRNEQRVSENEIQGMLQKTCPEAIRR